MIFLLMESHWPLYSMQIRPNYLHLVLKKAIPLSLVVQTFRLVFEMAVAWEAVELWVGYQ
jgi:hypothetical protein